MSNRFTLKFKFYQNEYQILIECLDNPAIARWYESAKETYQAAPGISVVDHFVPVENYRRANLDRVKETYAKLTSTFEELRSIGIDWPTEPKEFNFDQQWCNRIHRYFTTLCRFRKFDVKDENTVMSQDNIHIHKFDELIHIVNDCIHKIERTCKTPAREKFQRTLKSMYVTVPNHAFNINQTCKWYPFEEQDYQYHSWDSDCDVIFAAEISGKSIITSFEDNDDPTSIDTSGHEGWFGSFIIQFDKGRKQIYDSPAFTDWLQSYGVSKDSLGIRGDFPIGRVIDWGTLDPRKLSTNNLTDVSIIFHN